MKGFFKYLAAITAAISVFTACDTDVNELGGELLGSNELNNRIQKAYYDVTAYNALLNPVQTNNFNSMLLGVYNDPVYGTSSYDFVSQINLTRSSVDFGNDVEIDSVILEMPYFSRPIRIEDGETIFEIDSLYGTQAMPLQIFENGYFLNNFNAQDPTQEAVYNNDFGNNIETNIVGNAIYESTPGNLYYPSNEEVLEVTINAANERNVSNRLSPRIRFSLDTQFWENKLLLPDGTTHPALQSRSTFLDYFRGLYFRFDPNFTVATGHLNTLNINTSEIKIYTRSKFQDINDIDDDGDTTELIEVDNLTTLGFDGINVNFIRNNFNPSIINDIQNANDQVNGEENLYLKGGQGSMAILELFGPDLDNNGEADALTTLKQQNWLINEASLTLHVNQNIVQGGVAEPERILIYDLDNSRLLADYAISGQVRPLTDGTNHLGRLQRVDNDDETSDGLTYKIRLTEHVSNIITEETENVRLGLVVSQNVSLVRNSAVDNQSTPVTIENIPTSAAYSHEGTVLYGNLAPDPDKQLKLEVFYTNIDE